MITIKRMFGGVNVPHKKELSEQSPIEFAGIPGELVLFLSQHIGAPSKAVVSPKDIVKRGQLIAEPQGVVSAALHAPTSGTVKAIEPRFHPVQARMAEAIILEQMASMNCMKICLGCVRARPYLLRQFRFWQGIWALLALRAAFPSCETCPPKDKLIDMYLLNGAECEPYLADHRVMLEEAEQVVLDSGHS